MRRDNRVVPLPSLDRENRGIRLDNAKRAMRMESRVSSANTQHFNQRVENNMANARWIVQLGRDSREKHFFAIDAPRDSRLLDTLRVIFGTYQGMEINRGNTGERHHQRMGHKKLMNCDIPITVIQQR